MAKQDHKMGDGQPSHPNWTIVKKSFSVKKDVYAKLIDEQAKRIKETGMSCSVSDILDSFLRPILLPGAAKAKTRKHKKSKRRK